MTTYAIIDTQLGAALLFARELEELVLSFEEVAGTLSSGVLFLEDMAPQFAERLHAIRGGAAWLGFESIRALAAEAEDLCKAGPPFGTAERSRFEQITAALRREFVLLSASIG